MQMERYVETHMPVEISPLSTKTISSIRDWITSCVDHKNNDHTRCFLSEKKFLPSRLIEIEQSDSGLQLRLVRSQDIDPEHHGGIKYTTLSYCWGGNQPAKLIAESLASYEQEIPWAISQKHYKMRQQRPVFWEFVTSGLTLSASSRITTTTSHER
jgi:hypothetical protein